jgi:DHA2 family metal-tetracycline-proton antiporter-like MFS transporter
MDNLQTPADKTPIKVNIIVPMILFLMIFSLVIDNSFKIISPELVNYFGVSASTVSWQVTLSGLVIGIGAVVYAALSDSISIRNLLVAGIILICTGSLIGYVVHENYWLVVAARVIQSTGLGATETLYLITVAKYLNPKEQKKYMGFSTSSFQIATVIGLLTGGFISTYLQWHELFLIPLFTLVLIPFLWKYLPKDSGSKSNVDIIGMILVAITATSILICISSFDWYVFGGFILSVAVFFAYITKNKKAFISIDFFKNKLYASVLIVAFIIYSLYASYALSSFSFLLTEVYKVNLDTISLMFIPACISAAIVGALSGKFSKYFSSKQCVYLAIAMIILSVFVSILLIGQPIILFTIIIVIFSCFYAFMYAPLIDIGLKLVPVENTGTALGFYNLCINIAMSVGFTYSAYFIDKKDLMFSVSSSDLVNHYAGVLLGVGIVGLVGLLIYHFIVVRILRKVDR